MSVTSPTLKMASKDGRQTGFVLEAEEGRALESATQQAQAVTETTTQKEDRQAAVQQPKQSGVSLAFTYTRQPS